MSNNRITDNQSQHDAWIKLEILSELYRGEIINEEQYIDKVFEILHLKRSIKT